MRALVISGGGSKGAFAGGVAQFLIEEAKHKYDMFIGTSTGSLLVSHLALGKITKLKETFTNVNQKTIFNNSPFFIRNKNNIDSVSMNHFNILKNFILGRKTFGESKNLRKNLNKLVTKSEFDELKKLQKKIYFTVSNLSTNKVEFPDLYGNNYDDYLDWIWISCNFVPFMSLVKKNNYEYADGGFGSVIAIEHAINNGAKHVDAIILQTKTQQINRLPSRNPFDLLSSVFDFMTDRIMKENIKLGELSARMNDATVRYFFIPKILTTNSLIFNKIKMNKWWNEGYNYAHKEISKI
jgi:predicted patatin/cPLA2 family phospholipase